MAVREVLGGWEIAQALRTQIVESVPPLLEHGPADPVVAACRRDVAGDLLGVAKHGQAMPDLALLLSIVHQMFLSREAPTVDSLRQFQSTTTYRDCGRKARLCLEHCGSRSSVGPEFSSSMYSSISGRSGMR